MPIIDTNGLIVDIPKYRDTFEEKIEEPVYESITKPIREASVIPSKIMEFEFDETIEPIVESIIPIETVHEAVIEPSLKYMTDFIEIDWGIYSNGSLLDAPELIKQKHRFTIICNKVSTIWGLPSYRESQIVISKIQLLKEGITILDDSIFGFSYVEKTVMFAHETEGLSSLYVSPEVVIQEDPESQEWMEETMENAWNLFVKDYIEPLKKWIIIIVIILIIGVILYVSLPLLLPLISGFFSEKGKKLAKK